MIVQTKSTINHQCTVEHRCNEPLNDKVPSIAYDIQKLYGKEP